ncbi:hypothetical protein MUQ_13948 [Vibrio harveyi CAIM 1792]|nr:hypothetical protein MUQ_13948 [Vibrio harveyi CAIM 1792]
MIFFKGLDVNRFSKDIVRNILRNILTPKGYTYLRFVLTHKYIPSFDEPRSFSEKIIYRKFNEAPEKYSKLVDKFTVRDYVAELIGTEYLIPLIKHTDNLTPCDFYDLPKEFVIKTSNGGGGENVKVILDSSNVDKKLVSDKFNKYLSTKMGDIVDEHFYDIESPRIIFESLLRHKNGSLPSDYKFHVFRKGSDTKTIVQVDESRFVNHKRSLFDRDLKMLNFDIQPKYPKVSPDYKWPENIEEMFSIAEKLSHGFPYVRIDLYNVDGKIYFGEFTFCHGSGWEPFSTRDADFLLGSYWG